MTLPPDESPCLTVIDCRAPSHDRGSKRLLVAPGALSVGDGSTGHAVVLVRIGRPTGQVDTLFRGTSLYGAGEVATGAILDHEPDAVWLTDRSYFQRHWSPWVVERMESALATAAADADVPLVAWTGRRRAPESAAAGRAKSES